MTDSIKIVPDEKDERVKTMLAAVERANREFHALTKLHAGVARDRFSLFSCYRKEGFSAEQALELVIAEIHKAEG